MSDRVELGNQFALVRVSIGDLQEQDVNAHFMPSRVFNRLAENVAERGGLQSLPLLAQPGGEGPMEIVSGHHRIRAARAAGESELWCMLDEALQTRSEIVSAQLAHNALIGGDDTDLVDQLLKKIDNPDDLLASGLSDRIQMPDMGDLEMFVPSLDFRWKTLSFVFLPHQLEDFTELIEAMDGPQHMVGVSGAEQFEPFLKAVAKFARVKDVRSVGTAIALLTRLALEEVERENSEEQ